ncbi:hypothetical protein QBC40DRAFT_86505 [Triangularia verruculosa]|uniref:Uncharacterized protein n=1 Tax=Triangularia verruculosa TaxID=2587418 RepID=A0AAN7AS46_9PEZI|nr:hypothetical protein QBC40DRAFT_86505 [Triangularia verruculosa]
MDRSGEFSFGGSTPPRPMPPLALSEFIARATPYSDDYTYIYDAPASNPDMVKASFTNQEQKSLGSQVIQIQADQQDGACDSPVDSTTRTARTAPTQTQEQRHMPPSTQEASNSDWLSTRQQLLPSRNQGKKADWIRGWSEGVGMAETYCVCSEIMEGVRGGKSKKNETPEGNKSKLQGAGVAAKGGAGLEADDVCRNCSRPASPPPEDDGSARAASEGKSRPGLNLGKKVTDLLRRVKPNRMSSAHKRDAEIREWTRPNSQPKWLSNQRLAQSTPPPRPAQKSISMDIFPGRRPTTQAVITPTSDSSLTDSSAPPPPTPGKISSRLQRAAALLQRSSKPNE